MTGKLIRKRIMFYVQHLLGIGHLERALRLSRYLHDAGMEVTLISGGMPHPHASMPGGEIIQLAPVRAADAAFSQLLDESGRPIDAHWREQRKNALLRAFQNVQPDALLIEMFPFGRRQFDFELLPLLEAARSRSSAPLVLCSVRDIIIPSDKPGRTQEAVTRARNYFDYILVHGDASFIRLDQTYPAIAGLGGKVFYTGYVTADTSSALGAAANLAGSNEVTISAGGGAVGEALLMTAMQARAHSTQAGQKIWRILAGGNAPAGQLQTLQKIAPPGIIAEASRPDFPQLLCNSACSVSQGGYNTVMDILQARRISQTPAVIVPFATAREQEQNVRARALAAAGLAIVLSEMELTPVSLAAAIDRAILHRNRPYALPDMNGGTATAGFILEKLHG